MLWSKYVLKLIRLWVRSVVNKFVDPSFEIGPVGCDVHVAEANIGLERVSWRVKACRFVMAK